MKSIKSSAASAASMASLNENCLHVQVPPQPAPVRPLVAKTDIMVVNQQPTKSVRSPSLPPMTLPLTSTGSTHSTLFRNIGFYHIEIIYYAGAYLLT